MPTDKEHKGSYTNQVAKFYFAPGLRSVATLLYLGVYGYFTIYYLDNLFLAIRFLFYIILGHTALQGTAYLFTGMLFVVSLVFPFSISFYSIFVLHSIWEKRTWAPYVKWLMTIVIIAVGIFMIIGSDKVARMTARQPSMQSFIEDANLTGRI